MHALCNANYLFTNKIYNGSIAQVSFKYTRKEDRRMLYLVQFRYAIAYFEALPEIWVL